MLFKYAGFLRKMIDFLARADAAVSKDDFFHGVDCNRRRE
jgi:hypothetical protein